MAKILYVDKVDVKTASVPEKNKVVAANMNEIKTVVNGLDDDLAALSTTVSGKQATLVSGTNIKSINGTSLLASGDLVITPNATHSGDVAGSGVLTLQPAAITGKTAAAALTGTETVLIEQSGALVKSTSQAIADLGGGDSLYTGSGSLVTPTVVTMGANPLSFEGNTVTVKGLGSLTGTSFLVKNGLNEQLFKIDDSGGFALGLNVNYLDNTNVAIGKSITASADSSIVIGQASTSSGLASISIGANNAATGNFATAIGYQSTAIGNESIAIGRDADATTTRGISIGALSNATNNSSMAVGVSSGSSGMFAQAFGIAARANGLLSLALGASMIANATNSIMIGCANVFRTNSTSNSLEVNFDEVNSTFRIGKTVDGWLNGAGNFGIGLNSGISEKLHVNGNVRADGDFIVNGNTGFTGTGAYTNFTIEGGIITAAS